MTTGPVVNQVTAVAQSSQGIPQVILIDTNGNPRLVSSANLVLQSGAPPMINGCKVFPLAGTNYQAGQRQLLPKGIAQASSVSMAAQPGRKQRGPNKKRQQSAEEEVAKLQDITAKNEDGDTPLHLAACNKNPYYMKALLCRLEREDKLRLAMDCGNSKEQTPLCLAVMNNFHGIVSILVDKGADPNCLEVIRDPSGEEESKSAIHVESVNEKDRDYKRTLIELLKSDKLYLNSTNNLDKTNQSGRLLMMARRTVADMPRDSLVKSDEEGDTTLHILVLKQDAHLVQAMLERLHRENLTYLVDQENNKRQTPLYLAVCTNQPKIVAMFVKFQANVNVLARNISVDGTTMEVKGAIHVAASCGQEYHRTLVELLKSKDINVNLVNSYGQTALHCAILAHGRMKRDSMERLDSKLVIETLIRAGADPSAQDKKSGRTPLMYAIEQKSVELVEIVLKCVPKDRVRNVVRMQAMDGSTCLKIAVGLKGSFDMEIWNRLWNMLQSASNGSAARYQSPMPKEIYNFQVAT